MLEVQTMTTSMEKVQFAPLAINGHNYLQWSKHAVNHLTSRELQKTITADATNSTTHKAQALMLIQHHLVAKLQPGLQQQYMNEENPYTLWKDLKSQYDYTKPSSSPAQDKTGSIYKSRTIKALRSTTKNSSKLFLT
jgi:hypothetical protein